MCPEALRGRCAPNLVFCTADVGVADEIICDKLFGDRLMGVDSVGGRVDDCSFPLTKPVAVNLGLALPHSLCDVNQ